MRGETVGCRAEERERGRERERERKREQAVQLRRAKNLAQCTNGALPRGLRGLRWLKSLLFVPLPVRGALSGLSEQNNGIRCERAPNIWHNNSLSYQGIAANGIKRNIKFIMRLIIASAFAYLGLWHIFATAAAGNKCSLTFDGPLQCLHTVLTHTRSEYQVEEVAHKVNGHARELVKRESHQNRTRI